MAIVDDELSIEPDNSSLLQPIVDMIQVEIVGLADRLVALRRQLECSEWSHLAGPDSHESGLQHGPGKPKWRK